MGPISFTFIRGIELGGGGVGGRLNLEPLKKNPKTNKKQPGLIAVKSYLLTSVCFCLYTLNPQEFDSLVSPATVGDVIPPPTHTHTFLLVVGLSSIQQETFYGYIMV